MSYKKRLDHAFENAPVLPVSHGTKYVFFSDCHRGVGGSNDNFLKNKTCYTAALQYYAQNGFCYIEAGDGDELWENRKFSQILEMHEDVFCQLSQFHQAGRFYMLYGNHDMVKKKTTFEKNFPFDNFQCYEGIILKFESLPKNLYVTHGHQADLFNSVFWKLARFLVRYLWKPLEYRGVLDPTSAAKNNTKQKKLEKKYIAYAKNNHCLLLTGHTHRPTLNLQESPYFNSGSCVHPQGITCIELLGYQIQLVKWYASTEKSGYFRYINGKYPPIYPIYIKREVLAFESLL